MVVVAPLAGCAGAGSVGCGEVERILDPRGPVHVADLEFDDYDFHPPTSGPHFAGRPPEPGVHDDPVPEVLQVHALERGDVVLQYDDEVARDDDASELEALAEGRDDVLVAPAATPIDGGRHVAFTAWGYRQRCDGVSSEVIDAAEAFITEYVDTAPGS